MEIKLEIYDRRKVVKTYMAESYDIMFGTVEDLISVLDLDKIMSGDDKELVQAVAHAIPKVFNMVKPLLKDIFEGLTDEEIKHARLSDIAKCLLIIVKFSIAQITGETDSKN